MNSKKSKTYLPSEGKTRISAIAEKYIRWATFLFQTARLLVLSVST